MRKFWAVNSLASKITALAALNLCVLSLTGAETASSLRERAIQTDLRKLEAELHDSGAATWEQWFDRLKPFRAELSGLAEVASKNLVPSPNGPSIPLLRIYAPGMPPLYDRAATVQYLLSSDLSARPSVSTIGAFSKWLKSQGIDLLFVPVPAKIEVYPDRVAKSCPPDRIAAPLVRKLFHTMLEQDIEVVDLLPAYLEAAKGDSELLFLPTDGHWSERAQRIAADLIVSRLKRYPFVSTALKQPLLFHTDQVPPKLQPGNGYMLEHLTPDEREIVKSYPYPKQSATRTLDRSNQPFNEPDNGPILVIGDSNTHFFKLAIAPGTGIDALLAERLNLNVSNISMASATTQPIKELLRNQEKLKIHKVVIWIVNVESVLLPSGWNLPPFPGAAPAIR
jgi:hypothetical protein